MEKKLFRIQNNTAYNVREETFEGKTYLVAPIVMMVEGVHAGSDGPILHEAGEFGKFVSCWNGIPATINHPTDEKGNYISANSPGVLESIGTGRIFNAHMDNGKLKAEVWLDKQKLVQVDPDAYEHIQQNMAMSVSVGVFNDNVGTPGTWNNERYTAVARNYKPDHLALLPNGEGACSWADGCGIRVNAKKDNMTKDEKDKHYNSLLDKIKKDKHYNSLLDKIKKDGLTVNAQGLLEKIGLIRSLLDGMDTDGTYHFLEEVYEDVIIYGKSTNGQRSFYRQGYTFNEGVVALTGTAVPVYQKIEYLQITTNKEQENMMQRTKFNLNANEMTKCKVEKINSLIANKATQFTEGDKEWLESLEVEVLNKLEPVKTGPIETKVQVNEADVIASYKETIKTLDDVLALAPVDVQEKIKAGIASYEAVRKTLIDGIVANSKEVWKEEDLQDLPTEMLEKISKTSTESPADYSAQAGGATPAVNTAKGDMLYPAGVEVE